jgi:hypothetical protein
MKWLFGLLASLFLLPTTPDGFAQPANMGVTSLLPNTDWGNAGLILAQRATLSQAATLQSISFYVKTAVGTLRLGLYDSTGTDGNPGNKLAETADTELVAPWTTVPLVTQVNLPAGTYWLGYEVSSNSAQYLTTYDQGSIVYSNQAYGELPARFPESPKSSPGQWSFYATLDTNPAPIPPDVAYPLRVSSNHRYLVDQNSVPFLVTGDSAWSLIVNLTEAQAATYFANRKTDGFNTILISLFAGTNVFGRSDFSTYDGIVPFTTPGDISTPNPAYFQRVDDMINLAASYGLCVFLNPIENYGWEATFESSGLNKCASFGTYLGERYKNFPNVVWSHGNDYQDWPAADTVFLAIVSAIRAVDANHIHTAELNYNNSMSFDDPQWTPPIIGLNWSYTYFPAYAEDLHCYAVSPAAPYIMGESSYEQVTYGAADTGTVENIRRQEWWTACSGAAGQLYGSAWTQAFPDGWQKNLDTAGAIQLGYLVTTLRPLEWYNLVPDTTHTFVTSGYGTPYPYPGNPGANALGTLSIDTFVTAAIAPDGALGIAYLPATTTINVNLAQFSGPVTAKWLDPSSGVATTIRGSPFEAAGTQQFTTPGNTADGQGDWVLLFTR